MPRPYNVKRRGTRVMGAPARQIVFAEQKKGRSRALLRFLFLTALLVGQEDAARYEHGTPNDKRLTGERSIIARGG